MVHAGAGPGDCPRIPIVHSALRIGDNIYCAVVPKWPNGIHINQVSEGCLLQKYARTIPATLR